MAKLRIFILLSISIQICSCYSINPNPSENPTLQSLEDKINAILETENNESALLEDLIESSSTSTVKSASSPDFSISASSVSENHLVSKLSENTRRLESMVGMLVDLKSVLSQAVSTQEKQMALRTEVVELRDEISYLRDEVQKLKTQQATADNAGVSSKLVNKIHNDETTIRWLKDSMKELRHEVTEVSASINVTGLYHLKQEIETQTQLTNRNVENLQKQFQASQLDSARIDENVLEIRGDIADLRTWQANAGRQMLQISDKNSNAAAERTEIETNEISSQESPRFPKFSESSFRDKLNLLIRAEEVKIPISSPRHHQRKLRSELKTVERMLMGIMNDQSVLHQRLLQLEKLSPDKKRYSELITLKRRRNKSQDFSSRQKRNSVEYGASASFRLDSVEKEMADYSNTLENLDGKVNSLNSLRDSTTALFTVLEALETKYDGRLNEIQTNLGRAEAAVNTLSHAVDGVQEQQIVHSKQVQSMRKDLIDSKERSETNHLRMASLQSQILQWGLKTCIDESSEAIQNIKLAKLENLLESRTS